MQAQTAGTKKSAAQFLADLRPALEKAGIIRREECSGAEPRAILDRCRYTQTGQAEYEETWRSHPSLPLDISDTGNVRRSDGRSVSIWRSNKYKVTSSGGTNYYVHRLVLEAWRGFRPSGAVARHVNGDHADNALENLEWSTPRQNMADRVRDGLRVASDMRLSPYGRLRCRQMLEAGAHTQQQIGDMLGISARAVREWARKWGLSRSQKSAAGVVCAGVD